METSRIGSAQQTNVPDDNSSANQCSVVPRAVDSEEEEEEEEELDACARPDFMIRSIPPAPAQEQNRR